MPIDPDRAIGAEFPTNEFSWDDSDVLLYHLALGAGSRPNDTAELRYTYERDLRVLPTFGVVAPTMHWTETPAVEFPGVSIDLAKVLHGRQEITLHRQVPVSGKGTTRTRIADVQDKGEAAVLIQEGVTTDDEGRPLWTTRSSIFAKGEGGFGGQRGASERIPTPDRKPDAVLETPTLPQQALLYRLCGDRNPLHADPEFAASAGFGAPILHGLCTYGMVCKTMTDGLLDGEVSRVSSFAARFAGVVYPGETLRTTVWQEQDRFLLTTTCPDRDDTPVLTDAELRWS